MDCVENKEIFDSAIAFEACDVLGLIDCKFRLVALYHQESSIILKSLLDFAVDYAKSKPEH